MERSELGWPCFGLTCFCQVDQKGFKILEELLRILARAQLVSECCLHFIKDLVNFQEALAQREWATVATL